MSIFHVGNKSPMQRGFSKNIASDLLSLLNDLLQVFGGGLHNLCNFIITLFLNVSHDDM